jgi:hypothetical protein
VTRSAALLAATAARADPESAAAGNGEDNEHPVVLAGTALRKDPCPTALRRRVEHQLYLGVTQLV